MTDKDLNLSLDQSLLKSRRESDQRDSPVAAAQTLSEPTMTADYPGLDQPKAERPQHTEWLLIAVLASNLLMVIAIIFLLIQQPDTNNSADKLAPAEDNNRLLLESKMDQMDRQFAQSIGQLNQQLEQLQVSLLDQQRQQTSALLDLSENIKQSGSDLKREIIETTTSAHWHVNLGTFSTNEAATQLKKQIDAIGYQADINHVSLDDKIVYRVQLPGYKDRETAESTAREIMDKTNLNGLWAWEGK
jgi:cell division protein FtsN